MSSVSTLKNKFDGNDYRVSIVPVRKRASIPDPLRKTIPKEYWHSMGLKSMSFDNIIFEAAIFPKKNIFKPLFSIELDDGYSNKTTEDEFTKFIHHIIMNEKIEELMNGILDIYGKYNFVAIEHDIWNLFLLSKMRIVFILKDVYKN
ncbi:MAG: hypothetical protein ACLQBQ_03895 [Smithella sp.]